MILNFVLREMRAFWAQASPRMALWRKWHGWGHMQDGGLGQQRGESAVYTWK
jgi:hypothetical protein